MVWTWTFSPWGPGVLRRWTVSHHLKILSEAGLVGCRRQCNSLYFYVNQEAVLGWLRDVKMKFGCGE